MKQMDIKPQQMGTQARKSADTSTAARWLEYRYTDTSAGGGETVSSSLRMDQ